MNISSRRFAVSEFTLDPDFCSALGIEPTISLFLVQHSTDWARPVRIKTMFSNAKSGEGSLSLLALLEAASDHEMVG